MKTDPTNLKSVIGRCVRFLGVPLCAGLTAVWIAPGVTISQSPVNLGSAANFSILAATAITINSGTITGDVGVSPGTTITGFPPGTLIGAKHYNDAAAIQAQSDLLAAYNDAAGRSGTPIAVELGGTTLTTGVYSAGTFTINGTLTLDGSATDVFIFQAGSTLTTAAGSGVSLINGAQWNNVFWQVGTSATLNSDIKGNVLASVSITDNAGGVYGRLLAHTGAVTFSGDYSLPVSLSEFNVLMNGNAVHLSWVTYSEVDHLGFTVERKESGGDWIEIASYHENENLTGHGNTSDEHHYSYTDSKVFRGKTYSYRLLDVNVFGKVETRDDMVRTITVPESTGPESYDLVGVYPNPFNPLTTIAFNVPETAPVQLTIFNAQGQMIRNLQNREYPPGYYKVSWDAIDDRGRLVPGGVYLVRISSGQFTKVQKIVLLK